MKKLLFLTLIIVSVISCRTIKTTTTSHELFSSKDTTVYKSDSIFVQVVETVKDTHFVIKQDSATIQALIECDENGKALIRQIIDIETGERLRQSISMDNNIITVTAKIDSAAVYFQYKNTHIKEVEKTKHSVKIKETEKETTKESHKKVVYKFPLWIWPIVIGVIVTMVIILVNFIRRRK